MKSDRNKQSDLEYFQKNRKKLNNMISQVFGSDVHLHEISQDSEGSSTQDIYNLSPLPRSRAENMFSSAKTQIIRKPQIIAQKNIDSFRKKADYWDQTKKFIEDKLATQIKMNSINSHADDSDVLDQFLTVLRKLIDGVKETNKKGVHSDCERNLHKLKEELREADRKNYTLEEKVKILGQENKILRKLKENYKGQEKELKQQIEVLMENVRKRSEQNSTLKAVVEKLEEEFLSFSEKQTSSDKIKDLNRVISLKNEQISKMQMETRMLKVQLTDERVLSKNMKKIIKLAKKLNDEFIQNYQSSLTNYSKANILVNHEYFPPSLKKQNENRPFHLANKRLGIVKSRSLIKDIGSRRGDSGEQKIR